MARACVVFLLIMLALMAFGHDDSARLEAVQYCQMVHDKAWPDFHHVYAQQCHADGTVNEEYLYGR